MKLYKVLAFLLLTFLLTLNIRGVAAFEIHEIVPQPALIDPNREIIIKRMDPEAQILAKYLEGHNSPLQYHAQDFIDAAKEYNLDWRLVTAISGVESTFGKHIPGGYNGWGWGVYGTQAIYFDSWKDGIYTVSKGLRENYVDRGYTEPYSMNRIYAASPKWGSKVTFFMNKIQKFADEYDQAITDVGISTTRIAASSALLTYNTN